MLAAPIRQSLVDVWYMYSNTQTTNYDKIYAKPYIHVTSKTEWYQGK